MLRVPQELLPTPYHPLGLSPALFGTECLFGGHRAGSPIASLGDGLVAIEVGARLLLGARPEHDPIRFEEHLRDDE